MFFRCHVILLAFIRTEFQPVQKTAVVIQWFAAFHAFLLRQALFIIERFSLLNILAQVQESSPKDSNDSEENLNLFSKKSQEKTKLIFLIFSGIKLRFLKQLGFYTSYAVYIMLGNYITPNSVTRRQKKAKEEKLKELVRIQKPLTFL